MKAKTEELLYFLLWSAEKLMRPTFRNLTDSYESWAYRNGLIRQISTLERNRLLEAGESGSDARLYRLTDEGRLRALGGRDPEVCWGRPWDGNWRIVLFDVPMARNSYRKRVRRYLHDRGFGCVQGSVWVSPHSLEEERKFLSGAKVDVKSLLFLDAQPCAGESDAEIVASAWDFALINQRYLRLMQVLKDRPTDTVQNEASAKAMLRWAAAEREAWHDAIRNDPLLPRRLLPVDYLGEIAWRQRVKTLRQAGLQVRHYKGG